MSADIRLPIDPWTQADVEWVGDELAVHLVLGDTAVTLAGDPDALATLVTKVHRTVASATARLA